MDINEDDQGSVQSLRSFWAPFSNWTAGVTFGVNCQFERIWNHLEDGPLNMPIRDYLNYVDGYVKTPS